MLFWYFHHFIKLNILFQYICYRYVVFNIRYYFETEYVVILLLEMSYFHHFIHRSTLFILPVKAARCILQYTSLLINFIHAVFTTFVLQCLHCLHCHFVLYKGDIVILVLSSFHQIKYIISIYLLQADLFYPSHLKRIHDALRSRLVVHYQLGLATRFR